MDGRKSEMVSSSNSACLGGVLGGDVAVDKRGTSSKGLPWPANLVGRALFLELRFLNLFLILRHQPILAQIIDRVYSDRKRRVGFKGNGSDEGRGATDGKPALAGGIEEGNVGG